MERFGPYRVERLLGRGGMAEAFVAVRELGPGVEQRVCIKRLLPGTGKDAELLRGMAAEARIGASLRHANVVGLIDHGEVDGSPYLALELVDGVDLRRLLRELARLGEPMPWPVVSEIAFALGHALDHAHAVLRDGTVSGVLHRDISPSNVLIGRNGEIKLADFGIAKIEGETHVTRAGLLKGKIPYMAPEYVGGGPFDARCDLFALGVTLHECLVGERPFDGGSDVETLDRILAGRRVRLAERAIDAPAPLVHAIDALLAHDAAHRPTTARDLVTQLADVAPRATVRRSIACAVRRILAETAAESSVATPEPTWLFTPSEPTDGRRPMREPIHAAPDESTRTRL